jgi:hypothetical protein
MVMRILRGDFTLFIDWSKLAHSLNKQLLLAYNLMCMCNR